MGNHPGPRPPSALFFNVPGYDHVDPSLPLVAELARRGYRITYFTTGIYRERVVALGTGLMLRRKK